MGLFEFKDKEGPGIGKNEKKAPGYVTFFKVFGERFGNLVGLNLLYLFCCLPLFTIGAATAGFTYVLRNYSQRKHVETLHDFMAKCKEHFKKGLIVTFVDAALLVLFYISYKTWGSGELVEGGILQIIAIGFVLCLGYLFICTNLYLFPMMVSFDLPLRKLVKNSMILAAAKLWRNLAMIAVNGLVFGLIFLFWPIPLPLLLALAFSFCGLFNNSLIYPVLVKHIAIPQEKPEEPQDEDDAVFHDTI